MEDGEFRRAFSSLVRVGPAWEAGTFVGLHWDYAGAWVPQGLAPEMGAFEVPYTWFHRR